MLDKARSAGLPAFLADDPGVDSGLMIAQYTQAALVSENKRLAVPASADSIPSSAMQEDHVSMGWSAARKLRQSVTNTQRIAAIELLTAARALDLRAPLQPSKVTGAVKERLRKTVAGPGPDRFLSPELEAAVHFEQLSTDFMHFRDDRIIGIVIQWFLFHVSRATSSQCAAVASRSRASDGKWPPAMKSARS